MQRAVIAVDPDGARKRREKAEREDARVRFWRERSGTCGLQGTGLPADEALAASARIEGRARAYKAAGIGRRMDILRVMAYLDLLNEVTTAQRAAWAQADAAAPAAGEDEQAARDAELRKTRERPARRPARRAAVTRRPAAPASTRRRVTAPMVTAPMVTAPMVTAPMVTARGAGTQATGARTQGRTARTPRKVARPVMAARRGGTSLAAGLGITADRGRRLPVAAPQRAGMTVTPAAGLPMTADTGTAGRATEKGRCRRIPATAGTGTRPTYLTRPSRRAARRAR